MSKLRVYNSLNFDIAFLPELIGDNPDDRGFGGFLRAGIVNYTTYDIGSRMYIGNDIAVHYSDLKAFNIINSSDTTRGFNSFTISNSSSESSAKFKLISLKNQLLDGEDYFVLNNANNAFSLSAKPNWKPTDVAFKSEVKEYTSFANLQQDYDVKLTNAADGKLGMLAVQMTSQDKLFQHREILNVSARPHLGYNTRCVFGFFIDIGPTFGYSLYENYIVDTSGKDTQSSSSSYSLKNTDANIKFKVTGLANGDAASTVEIGQAGLDSTRATALEQYTHYVSFGGGIGIGFNYDFTSILGLSMHIKYAIDSIFNISNFNKVTPSLANKLIGYKFLTEDPATPNGNVLTYTGSDLVEKIIKLQTGSSYTYNKHLGFAPPLTSHQIDITYPEASTYYSSHSGKFADAVSSAYITKLPFFIVSSPTLDVSTVKDKIDASLQILSDHHNKVYDVKIGDDYARVSQKHSLTISSWGFVVNGKDKFSVAKLYPMSKGPENGEIYIDNELVGNNVENPDQNLAKKDMILYLYNSFPARALSDDMQKEIANLFVEGARSIIMNSVSDQLIKATSPTSRELSIFPSQLLSASDAEGSDYYDQSSQQPTTLAHTLSISVGLSYILN